jgi:hypothetical protein
MIDHKESGRKRRKEGIKNKIRIEAKYIKKKS